MRTIRRRTTLAAPLAAAAAASPWLRSAAAQQVPATAPQKVSITLAGGRTFTSRLSMPAVQPAPGVLVVPDGFGATDTYDRIGDLLAFDGFAAVVVDLFDGKTAANDQEAAALAAGLDGAVARQALAQWFDWLRSRRYCNQRLGSVGFGIGASHVVAASVGASVWATAVYYGRIDEPVERLRHLDGLIVGHFADRDPWATPLSRLDLEARLNSFQRKYTFYDYPGGSGFINPGSRNYDRGDAALAWNRTIAMFKPAIGLSP
jgi:carboxymethylenebutenolidase